MNETEFTEKFKAECGRPWFKKMLSLQVAAGQNPAREKATANQPKKETAVTGK